MTQDRLSRPAHDWDANDIEALVQDGAEEGLRPEFKKPSEFIRNRVYSREELVTQLSRTVSAFLNAVGGVIILGAQCFQPGDDKTIERLIPLSDWSASQTFNNLGITLRASQISDIIIDNVDPKHIGIDVNRIEIIVQHGPAEIFVITVPPSALGAHQSVRDYRYYLRLSDGDYPMEDHQIRAVNNRSAGPLLTMGFHLLSAPGQEINSLDDTSSVVTPELIPRQDYHLNQFYLMVTATNLGMGTAQAARFDIGTPPGIEFQDVQGGWYEKPNERGILGGYTNVFLRPQLLSKIPALISRSRHLNKISTEWKLGGSPSYTGLRILRTNLCGDTTKFQCQSALYQCAYLPANPA